MVPMWSLLVAVCRKTRWGEIMSREEARALRKQLNLTDLSAVIDSLPDDLFLVLRTE